MRNRISSAVILLTLTAGPVPAVQEDAQRCDAAARLAAAEGAVPETVMLAITRVETGRQSEGVLRPWPWTVNHAGEGHWFATREQAVAFVSDQIAAGEDSLDLGCFQLNTRWHGAAFAQLETMFDPIENARYAARFLNALHDQKGNWVDAVAAYHSQTPDHAAAYIEKVEAVLLALQADPSADATPARAPAPNRFALLQPGETGGFGSLVALGAGAQPLFGAP